LHVSTQYLLPTCNDFFYFCDTKVLEIELDDDSYKGMPFVLRSNQTWIKNSTSDFYLDFSRRAVKSSEVTLPFSFSPILAKNLLQKSSQNPMLIFFPCIKGTSDDSKGTAKALLERIADLEEDAQRSLMHR
jgi:alpha-glucan,water dikinase